MKKRLTVTIAFLLTAVISVFPLTSPAHAAGAAAPNYVHGLFIATELSSDVTAQEWERSLQDMAEIGIDTMIIQYSFQTDSINGNQAYFNYHQEDTVSGAASHPDRRSQIGRILAAAKKADMKVFLGLQLAEREWFNENRYQSRDWLNRQYRLSADLADSLWNAFEAKYADTIAGWYLPFEFESTTEYFPYFSQIIADYYVPITNYLKGDARFGNLPVMISPLMYWADDQAAWKSHLTELLSAAQIDIIAPQDGIGYGTQVHSTIGGWFRISREAVDEVNRSGKTVQLWANCENYSRLRNPNDPSEIERIKPMSISKFITSTDIVAPYVDNIISFSIHRWDTAQAFNRTTGVNKSYYEAYKRYYQTGVRPESVSDGYYVSIQSVSGSALAYNAYAGAGLTDGFAESTNWNQFCGISSTGQQPFTLEIRFDDPLTIRSVSSHYYQDASSGIALPEQVVYEYLIRSGEQDQIFSYTEFARQTPSGSGTTVLSSADLPSSVEADGIRITITPGGEWTFLDDILVLDSALTSYDPVPVPDPTPSSVTEKPSAIPETTAAHSGDNPADTTSAGNHSDEESTAADTEKIPSGDSSALKSDLQETNSPSPPAANPVRWLWLLIPFAALLCLAVFLICRYLRKYNSAIKPSNENSRRER